VIRAFYDAFSRRDAEAMAACYHDDVRFSDPVFPALAGRDASDMWRMLTIGGKDLRVVVSDVAAAGDGGSARWDAYYSFSGTGRPVHNIIRARFRFRDGKIVEHEDRFDFWRWSRQALGLPGLLLGWTPFLQKKVQRTAASKLRAFQSKGAKNA